MPSKCPSCGTSVERDDEELRSIARTLGVRQQLEGLVHFASRGAMDIRGLSYSRIDQLISEGLSMTQRTCSCSSAISFSGSKDMRRRNRGAAPGNPGIEVAAAIAALGALGIRHVGSMAAQLSPGISAPSTPLRGREQEIGAVRGIGPIIAQGVVSWFSNPSAKKLVEKLRKAGVNFVEPRQVAQGGALAGNTVVITGTLPTLSRTKATEVVENAGGRVTSSVSKATTFLVAGEEAGSKLEKARTLGVEIIDEAELLRRIAEA